MLNWDKLPEEIKVDAVKPYYNCLKKRVLSCFLKRIFDIIASFCLIVLLLPVMLFLAIWIKSDSSGPVLYKSERITRYGKPFTIFKFRTMITDADKKGANITVSGDSRITRVGGKIRKIRLDELPQLFNVLLGQMSFVGTRPEVAKYVATYTDEMMATLLMPAGITSEASIAFRDEDELMSELVSTGLSVDDAYQRVLQEKMKLNLNYIKNFSFIRDIKICLKTLL